MGRSILGGRSLCHRSVKSGDFHGVRSFLRQRAGTLVAFLLGALGVPAALPAELPAIVFVSRNLPAAPSATRRPGAIERAEPGRLLLREADGRLRVLVDAAAGIPAPGAPSDVLNPAVSYDGTRIVFAGYLATEEGFRIFEIGADGSGLRQLTRSDRQIQLDRYGAAADLFRTYDDVDPCYLPDGRICFVSTRYPGVAPDGRLRTTNLYLVNPDGSDAHRITTERFGADTPTVEPSTGRIVYSRWWRTAQAAVDPSLPPPEPIPPGSPGYGDVVVNTSDVVLRGVAEGAFPGVNSWFLSGIDPDGTDLSMHSGFRLDRELTQAHRPSFLPGGEVLALFIPQTPFLGYPRGDGLRRFRKGPAMPFALGGPQTFEPPDNSLPPGAAPPAPPAFFYAGAEAIGSGLLLVTGAQNSGGTPDYGVYTQENSAAAPALLLNLPGTAELDATPLVARTAPPVIAETAVDRLAEEAPRTVAEAFEQGGSFTFLCENLFFNGPVDLAIANAPPIGRRLAIEFYMAPQLQSPAATDPPLLIQKLDLPRDGKIEVKLPAGVPLFEVLRRPDGTLALGRDGQIFHVGGMNFGRAGETNRCVGCHAGHSQLAVPEDPSWTNVAPSAAVRASSVRTGADPAVRDLPGFFEQFKVVDRKTDPAVSEWAASPAETTSTLDLVWSTRIRGRQVVLHGIAPGVGLFGARSLVIHGVEVTTLLDKLPVQSVVSTSDIEVLGTPIALDPQVEFNALRITIRADQLTGLYEGARGAALAEIEVIAQATGEPSTQFLRGDADCNREIDLVDAIVILAHLFLGTPAPCCQAGADANDDSKLDVSDAIGLLSFMFLGGPAPAMPFPLCGPSASSSALSCDREVCF